MGRLIIASNRVPESDGGIGAGGLVVAVRAAFEHSDGLWFGWSGKFANSSSEHATVTETDGFTLATIDLTHNEVEGYYEGFANRTLWPAHHGRLDLMRINHDDYLTYRRVNARFAEALQPLLKTGDTIWVHDYHLMPLGAELRRLGVSAKLGFFLHIPFPHKDVWAALPWHSELLDDLCAYDLVGFQTPDCQVNFSEAVQGREADAAGDRPFRGHNAGREPQSGCFPISIDTKGFAALAASPQAERWRQHFANCMGNRSWAIGVERLDYTKGLAERLKSFETLLYQAPELHGKLSLVQIAAPSRENVAEYQATLATLDRLSGRINGRFGRLDWTPIHYINRSFTHTQLAALYRVCRIGVITPLRDGMNLVAKEYVAAQDPRDPGVLILSKFAGAAREMPDALIVNPYDARDVAGAMQAAYKMTQDERRYRWAGLMSRLEEHDVHRWCNDFLSALAPVQSTADVTAAAD
ncbi:MAG: alpha,alpha-trehalose-phosphate synthase (UDP-forming) [Alphaproteobacteria bacterium]